MQKKIAAALAAIETYMQEERDSALAAALPASPAIPTESSAWVLSARMETMTDRRMMQMRAFARIQ